MRRFILILACAIVLFCGVTAYATYSTWDGNNIPPMPTDGNSYWLINDSYLSGDSFNPRLYTSDSIPTVAYYAVDVFTFGYTGKNGKDYYLNKTTNPWSWTYSQTVSNLITGLNFDNVHGKIRNSNFDIYLGSSLVYSANMGNLSPTPTPAPSPTPTPSVYIDFPMDNSQGAWNEPYKATIKTTDYSLFTDGINIQAPFFYLTCTDSNNALVNTYKFYIKDTIQYPTILNSWHAIYGAEVDISSIPVNEWVTLSILDEDSNFISSIQFKLNKQGDYIPSDSSLPSGITDTIGSKYGEAPVRTSYSNDWNGSINYGVDTIKYWLVYPFAALGFILSSAFTAFGGLIVQTNALRVMLLSFFNWIPVPIMSVISVSFILGVVLRMLGRG